MSKNDFQMKKILNAMAYFSLVFVAVALILRHFFTGDGLMADIANVLNQIAQALAYIVMMFAGFYYARSKRNIWWTIVYIATVILVIIFFIIPLF